MKKYRLIKEYPHSPAIGTIQTVVYEGFEEYEAYPDFWKDVTHAEFISDDGVDICKGDTVFWVRTFHKSALSDEKPLSYKKYRWSGNERCTTPTYKWFSSEEEVQKYIFRAKPTISLEDLVTYGASKSMYEHFKKLVEKKEAANGSK